MCDFAGWNLPLKMLLLFILSIFEAKKGFADMITVDVDWSVQIKSISKADYNAIKIQLFCRWLCSLQKGLDYPRRPKTAIKPNLAYANWTWFILIYADIHAVYIWLNRILQSLALNSQWKHYSIFALWANISQTAKFMELFKAFFLSFMFKKDLILEQWIPDKYQKGLNYLN